MEVSLWSEGMLDMYLYESFQLLEQLEEIVISEEENDFFDKESIDEIFRILHTIKGSAGIMMYDSISLTAHKAEDIFYYLRETFCEAIPRNELNDYVLKVHDFIAGEFNKIKRGENADGDPSEIMKEIDSLVGGMKNKITISGYEMPPENIYTNPTQFYIAPAAEKEGPFIIDLGAEPETSKDSKERIVGVQMSKLNRLTQLVEKLVAEEAGSRDNEDWIDKKRKLSKITLELQSMVYDMRKTSLENTLRKMKRIVYDVSNRTGKDMELVTSGQALEVDRDIVKCVSEALLHLVRNAAEHGIEEKEERIRAGKNPKGEIVLSAEIKGSTLYIRVKDDGRGMDADEIYERARKCGIADPYKGRTAYSDEEIYRFITFPGFSTSTKISEYSGRGVGVDAAVNKIQEIGGILAISSKVGKETVMAIEIPMS